MSPQDDPRNLFAGADQERLPQGQGNLGSTPRHHSSRHNDAFVNNAYSIMRRGEPDPPDTTPYPELWMTDVEDGGEETNSAAIYVTLRALVKNAAGFPRG